MKDLYLISKKWELRNALREYIQGFQDSLVFLIEKERNTCLEMRNPSKDPWMKDLFLKRVLDPYVKDQERVCNLNYHKVMNRNT